MMVSPDYFREEHKNKSYEELIAIRDKLFNSIKGYENRGDSDEENYIFPSPDTIYSMELLYFKEINELIIEALEEKKQKEEVFDDCKEIALERNPDIDQVMECDNAFIFSSSKWEGMIGPTPIVVFKETCEMKMIIEVTDSLKGDWYELNFETMEVIRKISDDEDE